MGPFSINGAMQEVAFGFASQTNFIKRMKIRIGQTGLDFDRDYGSQHRTGWTAVHRGRCCYPYLTSFPKAVWALICACC